MKSILFLILVVATQITQSALPWVALEPQHQETKQITGWIIASRLTEFSEYISQNLLPIKVYNLSPNEKDKNGRLVICGYKREKSVDIFFVAIIHEKVVEIGKIHKAVFTPPPKDGEAPPGKVIAPSGKRETLPGKAEAPLDPPELNRAEEEAEQFSRHTILATRTWKNKSEIPELKLITAFYCQFALEFYNVGENGKILGIFSVLNIVDQKQYFCFGELETGKPVSEYRFSGMGIHYKTRIEAFRDLEKYTNKRKDLLLDTWLKLDGSSVKHYDTINRGILQLKLQALDRLKWPKTEIKEIQDIKAVFDNPNKLVVIFKREKVDNCYLTVAGMPMSSSSGDLTLTFLDIAKTIEAARNVMENYFNLAFSDKFKNPVDPWIWGWEVKHNISKEPFTQKLILRKDVIEKEIKKSPSFEIPEGGAIYMQKIRKRASVEGQFIAIYEFMGKIFMVIFMPNASSPFSLNFIGALGTAEEVEAAYEYFCSYGNDPEKFPFSDNSLFANGMGDAIRLPQKLRNILPCIFDDVKPIIDKTYPNPSKLEKGDVYINESLTTAVPAPFNRDKDQGPFWYCVAFEVDKNKTGTEGLIFFIIVKLYNDGGYSTKVVEPCHPTDKNTAYDSLKYRIYFDQFASLVQPRIR